MEKRFGIVLSEQKTGEIGVCPLFRLCLLAVLVVCWFPSSARAQDITTGLVGHWKMDEGSGGTAADSVGSADGTLSGPTWTTGQINGALLWSGGSENVDLGTLDVSGSEITISAWVRDDGCNLAAVDCRVISKANGSNAGDHWWMISLTDSGNRYFRFRLKTVGATTTLIASSGGTTIGQWYLVTVTYNGSGMYIYSNGVEVGSAAKAGALDTDNSVSAYIGQNPGSLNNDWVGIIDDVRIYSRALSAADVAALYAYTGGCFNPSGTSGSIVYNADLNVAQYCNGTSWKAMGPMPGAGGAGCSNPTGAAGKMVYNADFNVAQYCDGTNWKAMGPFPGAGGGGCSNPAGSTGSMVFNVDAAVIQYCDGTNWVRTGS